MINVEALAKAAYQAYVETLKQADTRKAWEQLPPAEQEAWVASANKVLDLAEAAVF